MFHPTSLATAINSPWDSVPIGSTQRMIGIVVEQIMTTRGVTLGLHASEPPTDRRRWMSEIRRQEI